MDEVISAKRLRSVLPILTRRNLEVPFITCAEMLDFNEDRGLAVWELAAKYESARGDISLDEVYARMEEIVGSCRHRSSKDCTGRNTPTAFWATNQPTSSSKWQAVGLWMEMS